MSGVKLIGSRDQLSIANLRHQETRALAILVQNMVIKDQMVFYGLVSEFLNEFSNALSPADSLKALNRILYKNIY